MERKEYQETKVMRTVSPGRHFRTSNQNLAAFDSNLDYLLEDLQNSVSRPTSSLANRTNSLNRLTNVKATSHPVAEYSTDDSYNYTSSDGSKHVSGYKKESYYKSSSQSAPMEKRTQSSLNQLDSLLDDLQQVKKSSFLKESESYNNSGLAPDVHKSSSRNVQRELHFEDAARSSSRVQERSRSREVQEHSSEGMYGDLRQLRTGSPSSRTSTLTKQTKVQNVHSYPLEVVETPVPDIGPEVLAHLDPSLHPPGNTKVTTTIKTYTYEIPGSGDYCTNLTLDGGEAEQRPYSPNRSLTTPSKSFVYSKMENRSENAASYAPATEASWRYREREMVANDSKVTRSQRPATPLGPNVVKETITTRTYQPGYSPERSPPSPQQTYVYNESVTTNLSERQRQQPPPTRQDTYIVEEIHDTVTSKDESRPPQQETYFLKQTHNTDRPYPQPSQVKTEIYKHETHNRNYERKPEPVNIQYKYKSESKTTNNYRTGHTPEEGQPLLPQRFPTDTSRPDGPPKKLDELMASIGSEPPNSQYNAGFTAHEIEMQHKRKIESMKQQQSEADDMQQKKEPVQKTKNVTGPPVYYPPGHEMFAKKEEAAWRAEGAYGREAGKYKYEAEEKNKSKSKSGAAIVPVCLPLCCGLPCTII